jgi:DNA-binding IclR family transcriptional regulator
MATTKPQYQVRALERALQVLGAFSLEQSEMSLSELAAAVDLAPSTALRLLSVLVDYGYVERSDDTDRYRLSVRLFERGSIYIQKTTIEAEAHGPLTLLSQECNQTASLAILNRGEIVHIGVIAPERPIRYYATIGQREMAHCTGLGKVLLAGLTDDALEKVVAQRGLPSRTDRTITSIGALRMHLEQIRQQGYAFDDEESVIGLRCIAAPILDDRNRSVAAISASGPAADFTEQTISELLRLVKQAAADVSARLGNNIHQNEAVV